MVKLSDIAAKQEQKRRRHDPKPAGSKLEGLFRREFSLARRDKLSSKRKEYFYAELSMLLSSGIDLKTSLQIIREGINNEGTRKVFDTVYKLVVEGKSLHESLEATGQFSTYEIYSVKIGEESGRLTRIIKELGLYYSDKMEQHRKWTSALSYPTAVVVVAVVVIIFMVEFVVPMFEGVFARFGRELPALTRWVLAGATFLRGNLPWIAGSTMVSLALFFRVRKRYIFKKITTQLLLKIPVARNLLLALYMHRFCQTMHLLAGAGIPLSRSVEMIREMISFIPLQDALRQAGQDLVRGISLHESMAKHKLFDRRACTLVQLGEEVNGLDVAFERLAVQYKEALRHQLELMNKLLEPLLVVLIGSLVALILIAMYLPMFDMGNSLTI
ncbi:MAG: type II secretion system F family protein [Odoribacteraceae bacterium]|jgi:type IV pilus assembly protein PilC|nr:type II secretion system F family protein [Odoribacteraceae bacterium]